MAWNKVVTSGSNAQLRSLYVETAVTASIVSASQFIGTITSASYALSASYAPGGNSLTSSYALTASYVPPSSLGSFWPDQSIIFEDGTQISGSSDFVFNKTDRTVAVKNAATINAITASGNINTYIQLNIQNKNTSTTASSDLVATNDAGNEGGNYIDIGINGSGYTFNFIGAANDAYVYNTGSKLIIANATPSTHVSSSIHFVVGGSNTNANTKMIISSSGNIGVGVMKPRFALEVSGTISSSNYIGNGSQLTNITSASYSQTSSFIDTTFSRGMGLADFTNGVTSTGSYYVWRSPYTCQVIALYGKKSGTGTSQVNARKSGSGGYSLHTASNLLLPTADQWASAASLQNTNYIAGESLEIIISGSGATQVAVQVDFKRI